MPKTFAIGVKLNSADYVVGGMTEEQALEHVQDIAAWRMVDFSEYTAVCVPSLNRRLIVDIVEISGGDYEGGDILDFTKRASPRQAFFSKFSKMAVESLPIGETTPTIMLTGSLVSLKSQFHGPYLLQYLSFISTSAPEVSWLR